MTTFGELCCEVCGGRPQVLHRANAKGEKGRWRCEGCLEIPKSPEELAFTDAIITANYDANASGDDIKIALDKAGIPYA